ncbi:MAG: sulfatase-like hydrolase/transferase, partial [Acidobacteriota bacterium]
ILAERELHDGAERLFEWLDENHSRRFFLFFHTYEVHFPYRRRQPYFDQFRAGTSDAEIRGAIDLRARPMVAGDVRWQHDYFVVTLESGEEVEHLNDAEKELLRAMYDSGIAYVDAVLGELFAKLRRLGLDENTLVIVTSDHGEALGEGDRGGHNYLYDWNLMVPLIIAFPDGTGAGTRVEQQVRSIDVMPTVLDVLGLRTERPIDGVSLRALAADGVSDAVPPEAWSYASSANVGLSLRSRNQVKYIFSNTAFSGYLGDEQLYDLRRDPDELDDRSTADPEATARLRSRVRRAIDEQHGGLRLKISHGGAEGRLEGRLAGPWSQHARVKAAAVECQCVHWGPGGARFDLGPGQEITLFFEALTGADVGLQGRFTGDAGATFDESFALDGFQGPSILHLEDGEWRRRGGTADPSSVAFTLWNAGEQPSVRAQPTQDQEVLEQLEALGYIDP